MNSEINKILQLALKNQEKVSNIHLKEFATDSLSFSYFTADPSVLYIPIFSENASVDRYFIEALNQLKTHYPSYELKLLFYTKKLKIFTYAYSKYNTKIESSLLEA